MSRTAKQPSPRQLWREAVAFSRPLSRGAKCMALILDAHIGNTDLECHPGIRRLAKLADVHTSTALEDLRGLEAAGFIDVTRRRGRGGTTYRLILPIAAECADEPRSTRPGRGRADQECADEPRITELPGRQEMRGSGPEMRGSGPEMRAPRPAQNQREPERTRKPHRELVPHAGREPVPADAEDLIFFAASKPRTPTTPEERERLENKAFEARRKKAQDDLDAMTAQPPVRRRVAR